MNNNDKYSRQLKIVGLCMANKSGKGYDSFDLAQMLEVENITIQRDLQNLRQMGIPIVQSKKGGITVEETFNIDLLREFLVKLIGIVYTTSIIDLSFSDSNTTEDFSFLKNLMQIILGIEQKKRIHIKDLMNDEELELSPLKLFQKDFQWHLLSASSKYGLQHYHIKNLKDVRITDYSAIEYPDEKIKAYIRNTLYSNFKSGSIKIKLQFARPNLDGYFPVKHCNYKLTKCNEINQIVLEAEVDSLDEVVGWLVENTPDVKIIEPAELIGKMKDKIESLISMTLTSNNFAKCYELNEESKNVFEIMEEKSKKHVYFQVDRSVKKGNIKKLFTNVFTSEDLTIDAEFPV